ncbi:DUF4232 domain-containing protein [Streptomyces sp. 2MCAF27]
MSIATFAARRARTLRLAAAGLTAVAAFTLTACNNNEGTGGQDQGKPDASSSAPADQNADNAGQEIGPCDVNKVTFGLKKVERPVNFMVLEVNNHAGVDCSMPGFPRLRFDNADAPVLDYDESKPQSVPTLAPGETAYAGISTSSADGSGKNGHKVTSLVVYLDGSDDHKSVELPGGSVYLDDSARVTFWQSDPTKALN